MRKFISAAAVAAGCVLGMGVPVAASAHAGGVSAACTLSNVSGNVYVTVTGEQPFSRHPFHLYVLNAAGERVVTTRSSGVETDATGSFTAFLGPVTDFSGNGGAASISFETNSAVCTLPV